MHKNIDESNALLSVTVKNYKEAAAICDRVAEVINAFDGKIFNVKLEKALYETTGKFMTVKTNYVTEEYTGLFDVTMRFDDTSIGVHSVEYDRATLCHVYVDYKKSDSAPIINKRIVARNIIPAIKKAKEKYIEKAQELIKAEKNIAQWKERRDSIVNSLEELSKEIPDEIQNYYNLTISFDAISKLRMSY